MSLKIVFVRIFVATEARGLENNLKYVLDTGINIAHLQLTSLNGLYDVGLLPVVARFQQVVSICDTVIACTMIVGPVGYGHTLIFSFPAENGLQQGVHLAVSTIRSLCCMKT